MYNNTGILVYKKDKFNKKEIHVSHLKEGTYLLHLQLKDGTQSRFQLVIQK